jgi:hypothetical protein
VDSWRAGQRGYNVQQGGKKELAHRVLGTGTRNKVGNGEPGKQEGTATGNVIKVTYSPNFVLYSLIKKVCKKHTNI